jgi:hypothetical protein
LDGGVTRLLDLVEIDHNLAPEHRESVAAAVKAKAYKP